MMRKRLLQWSHRPSEMETGSVRHSGGTPPAPFNGATALRRWKPPDFHTYGSGDVNLQWSHRPSAMETMVRNGTPESEQAFNGATALRRWKRVYPDSRAATGNHPSMEPPPFGDGNVSTQIVGPPPATILQWSHRPSAMETTTCGETADEAWNLQWSHRPSAMETGLEGGLYGNGDDPSMEPPPFGDGNCARNV